MPLSSLLPKTKTHKDKATQTHPNAHSNTRGHRCGHRARARALARALAEEAAVGRPSVAGHGAEGRRVRGDDKRRRRKQRRQGGMRAPCSGRRTPDRSPAAALRARINERQDETREMTRRRGCGCLRGRTSRGSRGFSDRGGAAALRKRADRRATGRGGKARLPGGAALKSAMLPEEVTAAAEERGITPWLRCRCAALEADERCPSYVRQMKRSSSPRPRGDRAAARGSFAICDARDARARRARERERERKREEREKEHSHLFHRQTADDVFVTIGILKQIQNTPHGL